MGDFAASPSPAPAMAMEPSRKQINAPYIDIWKTHLPKPPACHGRPFSCSADPNPNLGFPPPANPNSSGNPRSSDLLWPSRLQSLPPRVPETLAAPLHCSSCSGARPCDDSSCAKKQNPDSSDCCTDSLDSSSDGGSDVMDDCDRKDRDPKHAKTKKKRKKRKRKEGCRELMSKNLMSERKRRRKLNERLYTLRALVPNISKMDKASIVKDAIDYIYNLQNQVDRIQSDISSLNAQKLEGGGTHQHQALNHVHLDDDKPCHQKTIVKQEHRMMELEVSQMEAHVYNFRMHCKKSSGVIVQLTRALEALQVDILNANITSIDNHVLNTCVVRVKNESISKTNELRKMALEMIPRFGFVSPTTI